LDKDIEQRIENLGNVSVSPRIAGLLSTKDIDLLLARHVLGDYGEVSLEALNQNDLAMFLKSGTAQSVFETERGSIYVITRFNQPITTIAYQEEVEDGQVVQQVQDDSDCEME